MPPKYILYKHGLLRKINHWTPPIAPLLRPEHFWRPLQLQRIPSGAPKALRALRGERTWRKTLRLRSNQTLQIQFRGPQKKSNGRTLQLPRRVFTVRIPHRPSSTIRKPTNLTPAVFYWTHPPRCHSRRRRVRVLQAAHLLFVLWIATVTLPQRLPNFRAPCRLGMKLL